MILLLIVVLPVPAIHATAAEVQSKAGENTPPKTSFTVSFTSSVTQGDLLVAMEGTASTGGTFTAPNDTFGGTWKSAVSSCNNDCVQIWYAVAKSTGSNEKVTFHTPFTSITTYGFIAEFSGTSTSVYGTSTGSGTGNPSVTSFTPATGAVVVDIGATSTDSPGWTPGSLYTMIGGSYDWNAGSEFAVNWAANTATKAPWTFSTGGSSPTFGEVAASFLPANVTPAYQGVSIGGYPVSPQNTCQQYLPSNENDWVCTGSATYGTGYSSTANEYASIAISCPGNEQFPCSDHVDSYVYLNQNMIPYMYHGSSSNQVTFTIQLAYTGATFAGLNGGQGAVELDYFVRSCTSAPCTGTPTEYSWVIIDDSSTGASKGYSCDCSYTLVLGTPTVGDFYGFYGGSLSTAAIDNLPQGISTNAISNFYPSALGGCCSNYNSADASYTTTA